MKGCCQANTSTIREQKRRRADGGRQCNFITQTHRTQVPGVLLGQFPVEKPGVLTESESLQGFFGAVAVLLACPLSHYSGSVLSSFLCINPLLACLGWHIRCVLEFFPVTFTKNPFFQQHLWQTFLAFIVKACWVWMIWASFLFSVLMVFRFSVVFSLDWLSF